MNPSTDPAAALAPPPQPPQPHRLSTSCDRHPEERFTGFCPSCLCERLSVLDQTNNPASSSRKPPAISAAALKALFKPSSNGNANGNGRVKPGFFPELRRTKSFSASKNSDGNGLSGAFEPQRRSCDVRQSSLSNLFSQDEQRNVPTTISGGEADAGPRWQLRDAQSEIADCGYGRRSCDTDPRFSLDAGRFSLDAGRFSVDIGRISVDDPRYSFDEPRASWDGSLIGRTVFPAAARPPPPPSMLSVVEDAPVHRHVTRTDMQIPVEEPPPPPPQVVVNNTSNDVSDPVIIPGGSIQTRDYYTDSSSRRRKSLDRSSSIRKTAAAVVADVDEPKPPVSSIDTYSGSLRDNNYGVETTDNGFLREPAITGERKVSSNDNNKKSRRWGKWSILGLIYRKSVNKYEEEEEEERYRRLNGGMVERSLSESWPELRNGGGGAGPRMVRSNSNVSWRSSGGGMGRKVTGLERNKSSRYSPKNGDNGMWKFYLAPMKGSRRMSVGGGAGGGGGGGWGNSHGHSITRNAMRMY
ncbi:BnaC03g36190D [Brassica napus]|uniref:BnaC03g36190D protein n=1 Tax=Brassica napus TaxID=3708 RepID=A0A078F4D4_BRANA|nr:BnaC03g36190D [Brassica napus]